MRYKPRSFLPLPGDQAELHGGMRRQEKEKQVKRMNSINPDFVDYMGDARSEWRVRKAQECYQAGVQVGERALPPSFDGLLPWGWVDNRPFLRALHGLGLCQWRLGDFAADFYAGPGKYPGSRVSGPPLGRR